MGSCCRDFEGRQPGKLDANCHWPRGNTEWHPWKGAVLRKLHHPSLFLPLGHGVVATCCSTDTTHCRSDPCSWYPLPSLWGHVCHAMHHAVVLVQLLVRFSQVQSQVRRKMQRTWNHRNCLTSGVLLLSGLEAQTYQVQRPFDKKIGSCTLNILPSLHLRANCTWASHFAVHDRISQFEWNVSLSFSYGWRLSFCIHSHTFLKNVEPISQDLIQNRPSRKTSSYDIAASLRLIIIYKGRNLVPFHVMS